MNKKGLTDMLNRLAFWRRNPSNQISNGSILTPNEDGVLIDLRHIVKVYETPAGSFTALKDINIQVKGGEFVAVIGKSGSGKSTLINMMTGIDRPTQGEVYMAGTGIHDFSETQVARWRGRNLGVIFQFFQLLPTLSLIENVMLPMELVGNYTPQERRERGEHLLELVGLEDKIHKLPAMVSGGQQQRAAIARSLANDPPILVGDEPTGNLDTKTADAIFRIFEDFVAQGRTMLMVTHDRDLAGRVSRVIYIADGEVTGQQIAAALPSISKEDLVDVYTKLEPVKYGPGEVIVKRGDDAHHIYIIARGDIEVVLNEDTPQEIVIDRLGKGQYFGEIGLLEGGKRTSTVRVEQNSDAVVMQLDRQTFINLMENSGVTKDHIIHLLNERTERTSMGLLGLGIDQTSQLPAEFKTLKFEPGETIVEEGDVADKFYIISHGEVEVINRRSDGREVRINRLGYAEFFGEMGLMRGGRRNATVRATDHGAEVAYIDQDDFRRLMIQSDIQREDLLTLLRQRALGLSMGMLDLDMSFLNDISGDLETVTYQPGETIVQQDEVGHQFYIITEGDCDVIHRYPDGREEIINHLQNGQYFGEAALLHGGKRNATVRAGLSQVELLVMDHEMFHQLRRDYLSNKLDTFMPKLQRRPRKNDLLNKLDF